MVRILHIDDNERARQLVTRELRRMYPYIQKPQFRDQREMDAALDAERPVVMFTGTGNEEVAVEAMKAGMDDYVVKSPRHMIRLVTAVRSALEKADARRKVAEAERERADLLRRE